MTDDHKYVHNLKTLPKYFKAQTQGIKPFEVRTNDRMFEVGELLCLQEWSPETGYTGRACIKKITYILDAPEYLQEGYVVLGTLDP